MMDETFGQRLSRIRKEKGMTQEDIAKRIVISPQAVSKWENDVSSPDILVLSSLADILGVSVDELLGHETKGEKAESPKAEAAPEVEAEVVDDDKKYDKDAGLTFDKDGIHAQDSDGSYVHIGKGGVHIKDEKGERVDVGSSGVYVNGKRKDIIWKKEEKVSIITGSTFMGLALVGYILLGLLWTDDGLGWKCGWTLFMFAISFSSIPEAIRRRRICAFVYPTLVVGAYVLLSFLGARYGFQSWGFWWFLFITIPAYYMIFGPVDKALRARHIGYDDNCCCDCHDEDDD